jgi:predicted dehydrogenase
VDVVLLATPPGFRPAHIKAAVAAGKHIFTEKPMAVDAAGVRSVIASVEEAKKKNLNMVAGFCWRYSNPESETYKRILDGVIGEPRAVYGCYNTGELWTKPRRPEWSDMEWQVRNWLYFTWLSGDHIVEQAVHTIDKIGWTFNDQAPLRAVAHGGRQVRVDPAYGNIFDHFSVVYDFPNDAQAFLFCRQQGNCHVEVSDHILGTKGSANVVGFSDTHRIKGLDGKVSWKFEGEVNNMYETEHEVLFAAIRSGKVINNGARMMNSTMMAILGRMAAYTGKQITWEQAMNSKEDLLPPNLSLGQLATPPVAMPGRTPFL